MQDRVEVDLDSWELHVQPRIVQKDLGLLTEERVANGVMLDLVKVLGVVCCSSLVQILVGSVLINWFVEVELVREPDEELSDGSLVISLGTIGITVKVQDHFEKVGLQPLLVVISRFQDKIVGIGIIDIGLIEVPKRDVIGAVGRVHSNTGLDLFGENLHRFRGSFDFKKVGVDQEANSNHWEICTIKETTNKWKIK